MTTPESLGLLLTRESAREVCRNHDAGNRLLGQAEAALREPASAPRRRRAARVAPA